MFRSIFRFIGGVVKFCLKLAWRIIKLIFAPAGCIIKLIVLAAIVGGVLLIVL